MAHADTPDPLKPTEPGGEMEHTDPRHADDLEDVQAEGERDDRSFDPTSVEANRTREQGGGVGQRELDAQSDAIGSGGTEHFGQMEAEGGRNPDIERGGGGGGGVEQV